MTYAPDVMGEVIDARQGVTSRWVGADENAAADARATRDTQEANRRTIEDKLDAAMGEIQTLLDTPKETINAGPAPYIKALARVVRLLVRLVLRRLDGTT